MKTTQLLDRCWAWLVYALVGEELDENDDICGAGTLKFVKLGNIYILKLDIFFPLISNVS